MKVQRNDKPGIVKFARIDIESMLANTELDSQILLRTISGCQLEIIKAKHGLSQRTFTNVLQISVGNNAKLYNLDSEIPEEISYLEELNRFGSDPEGYINTGYAITHINPDNGNRHMIVANEMSDYYHTRHHVYNKVTDSIKYVYEQVSIFRTFNEIDLHEIEHFNKLVKESNRARLQGVDKSFNQNMREIDHCTLNSIFDNQTVFSLFFKVDIVYNQIHK